MKERKLDIFDLLRASDRNDGEWFSKQPDEAQKEFAPTVAMRWATAVADGPEAAYMLYMVNERVNEHLFDLSRHPDLVYRLLASCGLGEAKRHQWLPPPSRQTQSDAATNLLRMHYPEASDGEITLLLSLFDRTGFKQYVDGCGVQPDEAKGVMIAYDRARPEEAQKGKTKGKA